MAEIVHMQHPMHPAPLEIDDSRLQSMWARQHHRALLTTGALGLIGVAAILVAIAMVIWALRVGPQEPPVVNVTLPPQPAPLLPQTPPPTPQPGESPLVTEYTIFHNVMVDDFQISTGWNYHNSNDTVPYRQFCHWHISKTHKVELGINGVPTEDLAEQVRTVGVNMADAARYVTHCKWFGDKGALRS